MLVLGRKLNECIYVGDDIKIKVTRIGKGRVRIGIEAPREVVILREELVDKPEDCISGYTISDS
jgi:carbon storage regulator